MNNMNYLVTILISLFVGLGGFVLAFKIFGRHKPVKI